MKVTVGIVILIFGLLSTYANAEQLVNKYNNQDEIIMYKTPENLYYCQENNNRRGIPGNELAKYEFEARPYTNVRVLSTKEIYFRNYEGKRVKKTVAQVMILGHGVFKNQIFWVFLHDVVK